MPYKTEWVEPEVLLTHKGVTIYRLYKHDDCENNPPSSNYFTTNKHCSYDDNVDLDEFGHFDVRELDTEQRLEKEHPPYKNEPAYTKGTTRDKEAIDKAWDEWHDRKEIEVVKEIIKAAIDSGKIVPWKDEK